MTRMPASHQSRAGRSANGAAGIEIRKTNALSRQLINVWGLDFRLAVAAQVTVAQIVRNDEKDGWLARRWGKRVGGLRVGAEERGEKAPSSKTQAPADAPSYGGVAPGKYQAPIRKTNLHCFIIVAEIGLLRPIQFKRSAAVPAAACPLLLRDGYF